MHGATMKFKVQLYSGFSQTVCHEPKGVDLFCDSVSTPLFWNVQQYFKVVPLLFINSHFFVAQQRKSGLDRPMFEVYGSHTYTLTREDSPERVISLSQRTLPTQHSTNTKHLTSIPSAGYEPPISVTKRLQTHN